MQLLEQHFDAAFAAPDGIKKLRELILTLAMQGKLVEQDPSDQPASELLEEIEHEKRRLVAAGKIRTPKSLPAIEEDEVPYEVPAGWAWVRLGSIGVINPRNDALDAIDAGFVPMPMIYAEMGVDHAFEVRKWKDIKTGFTHFSDGDVGLAKITPCFENAKSCIFKGLPNGIGAGTTELHVFRNSFGSVDLKYLLYHLKNPRYISDAIPFMTGTAGQRRVATEYFTKTPFPLPSLAEQRRIVARIDELMARCDELEALRAAREQKRVDVHTAALNALLSAQEPAAFAEAWQFVAQHFSELHSVPRNVAELRKAVLQLAVMGKLVEQDPSDPPASELLKEIEEEKSRLIIAGRIRAANPLPPMTPEEMPYPVPEGWEWVRLNAITSKITDGDHQTPKRITQGKRLFSAKNVRDGFLDFDNFDQISEKDYEKSRERCLPEEGDLLIVSVGGTIGRSSLVPTDSDFALVRSVALIKPLVMLSQYLKISMDSDLLQTTIREKKRGGAQPCLYLSEITSFPMPLPPLPEQRRIVAKIDQLIALCDGLEAGLAAQASKQSALLASVMAAVTPASTMPTRRAAPARALARETVRRDPGRPRQELAEAASEDGEVMGVRRRPGRPRKEPAELVGAEDAAVVARRGPGRPRKNLDEPACSIPKAASETDAIRRLEALKIERAKGTRQVGLFESEGEAS
ncbi:restriction endonuclease subunit S [Deinococcus sp. HMF7604]|uniref:restriction endonuclease subunit S n=1 Tax=Deinococcus betulae TaxID=2873312 RepID=UPI001CCD02AA|nr:restriction endonuclease subunit S [Deinococcus betulae]MBZ9752701.1 restriction endonuclease subunit S [Deinococcus betulae]